VASKAILSYIITDEQIEESRLAQTPEKGEEAEGEKESTAEGCEITPYIRLIGSNAGEIKHLRH